MLSTSVAIIEGRRLRYAHPGEGDPVVLCHGFPENLQIWSGIGLNLALRRKAIAFDWPGLGRSEAWEGDSSPEAMANRLLRILDHLDIASPTLVATDMAVPAVLMLAAKHPTRVKQLVVMNSFLDLAGPSSRELGWMRHGMANYVGMRFLYDRIFKGCESTYLPDNSRLSTRVRADMWDCFKRQSVRTSFSAMMTDYLIGLERLPEFLPRIETPTLVLWGDADQHTPVAHGEWLYNALPHVTFETIPGGQHWMAWHRANEIADRILALS